MSTEIPEGAKPEPEPVHREFIDVERAKRIFATCRWAGIIAVTEMVHGYDAAMEVVAQGPARFVPDEQDWGKINDTAMIGITYVETGETE